jgi:hypothetical protein
LSLLVYFLPSHYPYYDGIAYNSAFFETSGTGLTVSQANAKYLQKTISDTATALETFNGITNIGTMNIIDSPFVNTQLTLKADSGNAEVVCDNGFNSVYMNALGIYATPSSTLTIASGSTATTINGATIAINAQPTVLNQMVIKNTATAATSTISLNPAANYPFISMFNTVDTLSFYVNPTTVSSDIQVLGNKTLNIATTGSNVDLNVGTGARTSAVIHNYSDGNNAVAGSNVHFNNGTSNLSNTNIHNGASSGGIVNIGNGSSATTGVAIGTRGLSTANAVRIGNVSNVTYLDSDTITMGALGLTGSGSISLANGTNAAGAQVSIGSTSLTAVNIKGGQTNLETTTLNLNTNGVGNTLIGTSGGSNSITINRPLTIGYIPSALVAGQIGYTYSPTVTWTNSIDTQIASQSLPAGVYMVSWSVQTYGVFINNFLYISGVTLPTIYPRWPFAPTGLSNVNVSSGSVVSSFTTTSTLRLFNCLANTQAGGAATEMVLFITRIA